TRSDVPSAPRQTAGQSGGGSAGRETMAPRYYAGIAIIAEPLKASVRRGTGRPRERIVPAVRRTASDRSSTGSTGGLRGSPSPTRAHSRRAPDQHHRGR